jgi:hypothetical protein
MYRSYEMPLPFLLFCLAASVFGIICMWKVFEKAGKPGWAAIIPIYNFIILLEMAGRPWTHIFFLLIPIYNIVFIIQVYHSISLAFGKDAGFTVGLVLLGIIFFAILAFGDAQYKGQTVNHPNTPLDQV